MNAVQQLEQKGLQKGFCKRVYSKAGMKANYRLLKNCLIEGSIWILSKVPVAFLSKN